MEAIIGVDDLSQDEADFLDSLVAAWQGEDNYEEDEDDEEWDEEDEEDEK